ncbi:hypothetical protein WMY93_010471 [Mugilogobius chulae]|uniref:Nuclear protein localization protein 4 homolog n=1 Tax=Mugilogobius chulae TaxID=88201 RepID=A0AAW0PGC7_9GOBI
MADNIIIRVQSPDGMKKIPSTRKETAAAFLKKVGKEFGFNSNGFSVYQNRNKTGEILSQNKALSILKIKHGDMLFLFPSGASTSQAEVMDTATPHSSSSFPSSSSLSSSSSSSSSSNIPRSHSSNHLQEDEIDQYLTKQDGKIYRNKDPQLCRHGALGKCVHCVPLEPFDEDYLNHLDPPVKHMSFHAYLRKLTGGADKGKFAALENISSQRHHTQQTEIQTRRQHHVREPHHRDRFLDFWRKTGSQRMGYLYGRYTEHKDIPLGIRAEVAAIYEPPQTATQNSLELLEDPKAAAVDEIAAKLGLCKVGWIFSDLVSEDTRIGTVRYTRNQDSYYLSAEECITAGHFQNQHSNPCRLSREGHFGSKFVTVLATGLPSVQSVHGSGAGRCLLPCKDAPELGYAKESSPEQYVPDVFYKDKDKFGNDVTFLARPLPVEYLIIDITTTFPKDPQYTFSSSQRFPIENREMLGETQDFHSLATYLSQSSSTVFLNIDSIGLLLDAVKTSNEDLAQTWKKSEQWATIEQLCSTVGGQPSSSHGYGAMGGPSAPVSASSMWSCLHCTFMNQPGTEHCEMCSLPRS